MNLRALALSLLLTTSLRAADVPIATILCYHEVDDAPNHATIPRKSATGSAAGEQLRYTITTKQFNEQLDYLQQHGYHVIPLSALADYLDGRTHSLPERAVVLTVDDGWLCAYTTIAPLLAKRHLPFTLFVYPAIVGHGAHAVNWTQVQQLSRQPNVEIGSHTMTHPFLTRANNPSVAGAGYETFLKHELIDSRAELTRRLQRPIRFLSYPYGDFDSVVVDTAKRAGYEAAVTTQRASITAATPPLQLTRYLLHNDTTLAEFASWLPSPAPHAAAN